MVVPAASDGGNGGIVLNRLADTPFSRPPKPGTALAKLLEVVCAVPESCYTVRRKKPNQLPDPMPMLIDTPIKEADGRGVRRQPDQSTSFWKSPSRLNFTRQ
jgi:hypothetical protein